MGIKIRIHVNGHMDYEIDNPEALVDASTFTSQQHDALKDVPPEVWQNLSNALVTEVVQRITRVDPPGVRNIDSSLSYKAGPLED